MVVLNLLVLRLEAETQPGAPVEARCTTILSSPSSFSFSKVMQMGPSLPAQGANVQVVQQAGALAWCVFGFKI